MHSAPTEVVINYVHVSPRHDLEIRIIFECMELIQTNYNTHTYYFAFKLYRYITRTFIAT